MSSKLSDTFHPLALKWGLVNARPPEHASLRNLLFPRAVDPHSFFADPDPAVFSECGSGSGSRR